MLVALGIKPDGKKEIVVFRQVPGKSKAAWRGFLTICISEGSKGMPSSSSSWTEGKDFWLHWIWSMARCAFSGVGPIRPAMYLIT